MSMLLARTYGVFCADRRTIRAIAADTGAADRAVALVFASFMVGTAHFGLGEPARWVIAGLFMATAGLAVFAVIASLLGRAIAGGGSVRAFLRTGGYAMAPVALGVVAPFGLVVGVAVAFGLTTGIVRALHDTPWLVSALTALIPMTVLVAAIQAVTAAS